MLALQPMTAWDLIHNSNEVAPEANSIIIPLQDEIREKKKCWRHL